MLNFVGEKPVMLMSGYPGSCKSLRPMTGGGGGAGPDTKNSDLEVSVPLALYTSGVKLVLHTTSAKSAATQRPVEVTSVEAGGVPLPAMGCVTNRVLSVQLVV